MLFESENGNNERIASTCQREGRRSIPCRNDPRMASSRALVAGGRHLVDNSNFDRLGVRKTKEKVCAHVAFCE